MARESSALIELKCPCCEAALKIDPATGAVIHYVAKQKPPPVESLTSAVEKLKGESARREKLFARQMAEQQTHQQVLDRKFDELLKQAKESPDLTPPKKDIDLD